VFHDEPHRIAPDSRRRDDLAFGAKRSGATGVAVSVVVSSDGSTLSDEDDVKVQIAFSGGNPMDAKFSGGAFQAKVRTPAGVPKRIRVTVAATHGETVVRETTDVPVKS
jgi:hypothetical protein